MPVTAFCVAIGHLRGGVVTEALPEHGDAAGQELPRLGDLGAAVDGRERVAPPRDVARPTTHANSRPGSAATTSERVSHVRSGSTLRPVKCAPHVGPSPSSHQHSLQIGLYSPMRVTSATSS